MRRVAMIGALLVVLAVVALAVSYHIFLSQQIDLGPELKYQPGSSQSEAPGKEGVVSSSHLRSTAEHFSERPVYRPAGDVSALNGGHLWTVGGRV